jgi:L-phenylalanine/L-methionine N-acetyltransferase
VTLRVRRAEPRDAPALVALARDVGGEPEGWLIADGAWRSVGDERRHLRLARRSAHVAVIVAETEAGIVGRLSISRDPHPASRHVADVGLMVEQSARRQGVGTALLAAAELWARAGSIRKIELHVFPYNSAAIALYERAGYVREGLRRAHFARGGEFVDAFLMSKILD